MAGHDKKVKLIVRPDPSATCGYSFDMEGKDGSNPDRLRFNKRDMNADITDHHRIIFDLENRDGARLEFSQDLRKVMWVKKVRLPTDPCPDQESHLPGEFFVNPKRLKPKRLVVINMNMKEELLAFAINLVREGEVENDLTNYVLYDPVAENRNGGGFDMQSAVSARLATAATIGAAIGATAIAAIGSLTQSGRGQSGGPREHR